MNQELLLYIMTGFVIISAVALCIQAGLLFGIYKVSKDLQQQTAAVGGKSGTLPVDGHASEFRCFLPLCRRFRSLALLSQNAREGDVRSGLIRHHSNGLAERIGCFREFILLLVDASQDGPAIPVFWP